MSTPGTDQRSTGSTASSNGGARVVRLRIPAKAEYITLGRLALTGLSRLQDLSEETLADVKLALTEACSNSVRHAYRDGRDGNVEIVYELEQDRLTIEVLDDGPGFDYVEADGEDRELTEGGLGIAIIRSLSDEFELGERATGGGSRLRFVKHL
jgi:serine/threonine-protein kinase RsbW